MFVNPKEASPKDLRNYIFPADLNHIRCVDERKSTDQTNGVQIPGGIYGIVDAIKALAHAIEEDAWQRVKDAKIPIDAHIDNHDGARGCGYARTVEDKPQAILAPDSVTAQERLDRVQQVNGGVLHYIGKHDPSHATINYWKGFTLDPNKASVDGLGVFNCDAWATRVYAEKLGLDPNAFEQHIVRMYEATVKELTGITTFHEFR